jgi:hypothetical protein
MLTRITQKEGRFNESLQSGRSVCVNVSAESGSSIPNDKARFFNRMPFQRRVIDFDAHLIGNCRLQIDCTSREKRSTAISTDSLHQNDQIGADQRHSVNVNALVLILY